MIVVVPEKWPVGILTDRDIVIRAVASERDLADTTVGDIMSAPVRTIAETAAIEEALGVMRRLAVRRLVVTRDDGVLAGLLSLDDVIERLADDAGVIASLLRKEVPAIHG